MGYRNSEKYSDPTAGMALANVDIKKKPSKAQKKFLRTLKRIHKLCEIDGFELKGRIVLKDKETGRIWR